MEECRLSKPKIAITVSYMLLILMTSLIPMDQDIRGLSFMIGLEPIIQSLLHIPMFAILAILSLQLFKAHQIRGPKRITLVLLFCISFGMLNEIIQIFVPGRYAGILEIGLNTIGVLCGVLLSVLVDRSKLSFEVKNPVLPHGASRVGFS